MGKANTLTFKQSGFTIVELLIVIVVIGILAAITIVAFNGVQQRAATAAVQSDLAQNAKVILAGGASSSTGQLSSIAVMPGGTANVKLNLTRYKVATYCGDGTNFVLALQTTAGDTYYTKTGGAIVKDNTIDDFLPCSSLGINPADTTFLNLPAVCAAETASCAFTGPVTLVYGSATQGKFARIVNPTSPVSCHHSALGVSDPSPGFAKACYVYPN